MTLKILHLADVHLDHPYLNADAVPGLSRARRHGLRQSLQRALELAREREVAAVTIAGDLFESEHLSLDTLQFVLEQFRAIEPIQVFIAPGDRDPAGADSYYTLIDWPRNVHIFREPQLTPLTLRDEWLIWGFGYNQARTTDPVLADFTLPTEKPSVLLLHGAATDLAWPAGDESVVPFSFADVSRAGFKLALLGHRHESYFATADDLSVCYAGSPEPLSFAETNGHAVWLAEWDNGVWQLENIDISQWRCYTWQFDVSGYSSPAQVKAHIRGLWDEVQDGRPVVAAVVLRGEADPNAEVTLDDVVRELADELPALRIDNQTETAVKLDALTGEMTVRGSFVRHLTAQTVSDEATRRLNHAALQHGLKALQGQRVNL
ncbi:MAG: metallophosphoesterase family protein [Chloroflexi bacterium]|nr:metallophosphoesterase family protein [Chloroflexota bacterium]